MPDTVSLFNPNLGGTIDPNVLSAYLTGQQGQGSPAVPGIYEGPISPKYGGSGQTGVGNQFDEAGTGIVPGEGTVTGLDASGAPIYNNGGFDYSGAASMAGGIGALGQSISNLYYDVNNRKLQKKMWAEQQANLLANYAAQQTNATAGMSLAQMTASQREAALQSALAARGVSNSSIADQQKSYLDYETHAQLAAAQRQIALNTTNFNTQEALLQLQKEMAHNIYAQQMFSQGMQAAGAAASIAFMAFSDPDMKKDVHPVDKESALENINEIPVSSWKYKSDPVNKHLGPMADDVKDVIGGDGHTIDLVSMNGQLMAAVQALTDKVNALEKRTNA